MQFTNSFEVSLPPEEAWPLLMDIPAVVPCMPGAEIVERIDERSFKGKISVRLGPVGLVFLCDASFTDIDDAGRRATVQAAGADAKGRGSAQAEILFHCQPSATGSKVVITTDLALSGAVAQYGRGAGLIQNVANQIIGQFARNLEARIGQIKAHASAQEDLPQDAAAVAQPGAAWAGAGTGNAQYAGAASTAPVNGAADPYTAGYREGFGAGFTAGHNAGMAAALALQRAGRPVVPPGQLPPMAPARPIGGISLIFSSLWASVRGWFSGRAR